MSTLDHALAWVRGEQLEHASVGIFGLSVLLLSGLYWKYGTLPHARSLVIPFLVVGCLFLAIGTSGLITNNQRVSTYRQQHDDNPHAFLDAEIKRTAGFLGWYRYTLAAGSLLVFAGLCLFTLAAGPTPRGIALALMLVGFGGLLIDNVSEANAKAYSEALMRQPAPPGR